MKRRSKVSGKSAKAQRSKTPKPTRRNRKVETPSRPSAVAEEQEVAELVRERDEALEQQAATSEVLHIVSELPGDLEPVYSGHAGESRSHLRGQLRKYLPLGWRGATYPGIAQHPACLRRRR